MNAKSLEMQISELAVTVAELRKTLADHEKVIAGFRTALGLGGPAGAGDIASDADLDGEYGNEQIRMNPRDWKGTPRKGERMAHCEPEFLELYALTMDWFASENEAKGNARKAKFDRLVAARARGWAKRLREGWTPPEPAKPAGASAGGAWGKGSGWGAPRNAAPAAAPPAPAQRPPNPPQDDPGGAFSDFVGDEDDQIPFD